MFFCSISSAVAGVSVSIGLNVPVYPQLVPVSGYPVYYTPGLNSNYFFYDGMYWVFVDDNWYAVAGTADLGNSSRRRAAVHPARSRPLYRYPPVYFRAWYANAPPRWGEHWGSTWERHHRGWNTWNRAAVPARLPVYQRQYSEPDIRLSSSNLRCKRKLPVSAARLVVRQHYQASSRAESVPAPAQQGAGTCALSTIDATSRSTAADHAGAVATSRRAAFARSAHTNRARGGSTGARYASTGSACRSASATRPAAATGAESATGQHPAASICSVTAWPAAATHRSR